jgi:hypothetical protein
MKYLPVAAACAVVLLGGCASVIEGSTEQLTVNTVPVEGATCVLSNSQGKWTVTTPGAVTVHKSNSVLVVTCNKDGYGEAKFYASGKMSSAAMVGTMLPYVGILSSAVDGSSGAALTYPDQITIALKPSVPEATPAASSGGATPMAATK